MRVHTASSWPCDSLPLVFITVFHLLAHSKDRPPKLIYSYMCLLNHDSDNKFICLWHSHDDDQFLTLAKWYNVKSKKIYQLDIHVILIV